MPTPVPRLVASSEASLTTTVSSAPPALKVTRKFWLIWPVPIRSHERSSIPGRPSTDPSHSAPIWSGVWISGSGGNGLVAARPSRAPAPPARSA